MRILFVNQHILPIGGTELYLANLVRSCASLGIKAMVAYTSSNSEVADLPCPIVHLSDDRYMEGLEEIKAFRPDLIQLNGLPSKRSYSSLCAVAPTILMLHSQFPLICPGDGKFSISKMEPCVRKIGPYCMVAPLINRCGTRKIWLQRRNFEDSRYFANNLDLLSQVVVASEFMKNQLAINDIRDDLVAVNQLGIPDIEGFTDCSIEDLPTFVFAGRLIPAKGAELLVRALERVETPISLVVIGTGPQQAELASLGEKIPKHHKFVMPGWQDQAQIIEWYEKSRAVVFPSLWDEPFGLVGIEAMRSSRPVIAFERGAVSEWLEEGETGLVVEPTVQALADAVELLAKDKALAMRLGQAGRRVYEYQFTMDLHINRLKNICTEIIERSE